MQYKFENLYLPRNMDMKISVNNKNQINNFQISSYSVKMSCLRIKKKGLTS